MSDDGKIIFYIDKSGEELPTEETLNVMSDGVAHSELEITTDTTTKQDEPKKITETSTTDEIDKLNSLLEPIDKEEVAKSLEEERKKDNKEVSVEDSKQEHTDVAAAAAAAADDTTLEPGEIPADDTVLDVSSFVQTVKLETEKEKQPKQLIIDNLALIDIHHICDIIPRDIKVLQFKLLTDDDIRNIITHTDKISDMIYQFYKWFMKVHNESLIENTESYLNSFNCLKDTYSNCDLLFSCICILSYLVSERKIMSPVNFKKYIPHNVIHLDSMNELSFLLAKEKDTFVIRYHTYINNIFVRFKYNSDYIFIRDLTSIRYSTILDVLGKCIYISNTNNNKFISYSIRNKEVIIRNYNTVMSSIARKIYDEKNTSEQYVFYGSSSDSSDSYSDDSSNSSDDYHRRGRSPSHHREDHKKYSRSPSSSRSRSPRYRRHHTTHERSRSRSPRYHNTEYDRSRRSASRHDEEKDMVDTRRISPEVDSKEFYEFCKCFKMYTLFKKQQKK